MAKKTAKKKTARKPNAAFMRPVTPSDTLAPIVGAKAMPRTEDGSRFVAEPLRRTAAVAGVWSSEKSWSSGSTSETCAPGFSTTRTRLPLRTKRSTR